MKPFALLTAILVCSISWAGDKLSLYDGRVSVALPDGFSRMSDELASVKYPRGNRPNHIFADAKTTTSIAVSIAEAKVTPAQLGDFRAFMEKTFERMIPAMRWLKKDFINIGNVRWARLELMSNAVDTDIHNIILITVLDSKPLMFNYNSTKEQFSALESALAKSIDSIRVEERLPTKSP